MLRRPLPGEEEEDLLEFQRKFVEESKSNPSATLIKAQKKNAGSSKEVAGQGNSNPCPLLVSQFLIGEIVERRVNLETAAYTEDRVGPSVSGFPEVEKLGSYGSKGDRKKGSSIFAQKMAAKNKVAGGGISKKPDIDAKTVKDYDDRENVVQDAVEPMEENIVDFKSIHAENEAKLRSMSDAEIVNEQEQLISRLGTSTVEFLRNRAKNEPLKQPVKSDSRGLKKKVTIDEGNLAEKVKKVKLTDDISDSGQYIWESDLPEPKESKQYSVRFDLQGFVVTDNQLPVHLGLHHHGKEPEVPGYTVEELLLLSKSASHQQKLMSVRTLGLICRNAKLGCFVGLEMNVFQFLLDRELPVLYRLFLDESSVASICMSVQALKNMLCSVHTENVFECASFLPSLRHERVAMSSLCSAENSNKKSEEVMKKDLIKGLVRTNLIQRLRYVLEVTRPPFETKLDILIILNRICRHSASMAYEVFKCPRLINWVIEEGFNLAEGLSEFALESIKLMSNLAVSGINMAKNVLLTKHLENYLMFCLTEDFEEKTGIKLAVFAEANFLCEVLLTYGLFFEQLSSVISSLLLRTAKLQSVDLEKCSSAEIKFLISHFALNRTLACHIRRSKLNVKDSQLVFVDDLTSLVVILCLRWLNPIIKEGSNCSTLQFSLFSVLIAIISDSMQGKEVAQKEDVSKLVTFLLQLLNSIDVRKLFKSIVMDFPYRFVLSQSLVESFFDVDLIRSTVGHFEFISQLTLLLGIDEGSLDESEYNRLGLFLEKLLAHFLQVQLPLPEGKEFSTSYGYFLFKPVFVCLKNAVSFCSKLTVACKLQKPVSYSECISVTLKLISDCPSGFSHLIKSLFCELLFDIKTVADKQHELIGSFDQLNIGTKSNTKHDLEALINAARHCYSEIFQSSFTEKSCETLVIHLASSGPEMPMDWLFLPILKFLKTEKLVANESVVPVGFEGHAETFKLKCVRVCLEFVSFLHSKKVSTQLTPNLTFDRLMCVFMLSPDVFMDEAVQHSTRYLFTQLVNSKQLTLNESSDFLGAFHEHYISLLEHFEAESFGDVLFANFVLFPMCTRFEPKFRRAVWVEFTNVFKVMRIKREDLMFPFEWLIYPEETDQDVLNKQNNCLTGDILIKCPVLLAVARNNQNNPE